MSAIEKLLTDNIAIWTSADIGKKTGRGRSSTKADSVYGISKLRELILELAVRGKLVPQDPNDEPASELLKRIKSEKARLVVKGKIKKEKLLPSITEDEKPFDLPPGWNFARFGDFVLSILSGGTPSKNNSQFWNGDIPWASVKDLNVEKFIDKTQDYITKEGLDAGSKLANKGDLIICTRMGLGKIAIAAVDIAINQDLKALKLTSLLDVNYFINFYSTLKILGSGMTVAGIKQDELLGYYVPTPPLAEQRRIVAKIDELMALCDQMETQHINAAEAHEKLVIHVLSTLTQSQNAEEYRENWQRIAAHFDTLFTTEASIDALKKTILQLGVMGKLVPQNSNDESARELLKRIKAEKAKLVAQGKIKKDKSLPPISFEERPFDLPPGWNFARFGDFVLSIVSGGTPSKNNSQFWNGDIPWASVKDLNVKKFIDKTQDYITKEGLHAGSKLANKGDLIICTRMGLGKIAIAAVNVAINQDLKALKLTSLLDVDYFINFYSTLKIYGSGMTVAGIKQEELLGYCVPTPPLAEQRRIVAKIDELMMICDQFKSRIAEINQLQRKLADTIVKQAVVL